MIGARRTDDAGRYAFADMTPASDTLPVSAPSCWPAALAVSVASGASTPTAGAAGQPAASGLEGIALTSGGVPVADARVTLPDGDRATPASTTTGPDGRYASGILAAGGYTVIASGYPPTASTLRVEPGGRHSRDVQPGHPQA